MLFRRKNISNLHTSLQHSSGCASVFTTQVKQKGPNVKHMSKPWRGNPGSILGHPCGGELEVQSYVYLNIKRDVN